MTQPGPRDHDPYATDRMPDEQPRDLDAAAPGRWVAPERRSSADRRAESDRRQAQDRRQALLPYDGVDRRQAAERRSGEDRREVSERRGWQAQGGMAGVAGEPNRYGLPSKAQELYPQAFRPVDTEFWRTLSAEQQQEQMRLQAAAQERVGFERNTPKFFIGDVQPSGMPGPGEAPGPAEALSEADEDYQLKRKHYQRRKIELEEIKQGKRKRVNQFTQSRDEGNVPVLALPTVIQGIKATPALNAMLPDVDLPQIADSIPGAAVNSSMPLPQGSSAKRGANAQPGAGPEVEGGTFYAPAEPAQPAADRRVGGTSYSGPERRKGGDLRRPTPDYGHTAEVKTHKLSGKAAPMASSNTYGLKSRSEMSFPQAYAPVSREMWAEMSEEQKAHALRLQAIAQEKVGFEKSAPKFFIDDFDPSNPNAPATKPGNRNAPAVSEVSLAAPRLIMGGVLIGAGGMLLALALGHMLPSTPGVLYGICGVALIGGVLLAANPGS
jgi:hypothetical protein